MTITLDDVRLAAERLKGVARLTPAIECAPLSAEVGSHVFWKGEHLQHGGAFKYRGASNAVAALGAERRAAGVVAASSGNHARAVALAAARHAIPATILMPHDAPPEKAAATRAAGAHVRTYDRYTEDRDALLAGLSAESGRPAIHAYDDEHVIAGQGTVALELLEQAGPLDLLLVPVGGGGLISGCATVVAALAPDCRVVGVEPAAGDDTRRSLQAGERVRIEVPHTIADGQQVAIPGAVTFPIVQALVDEVVTVSDDEIVAAMATLARDAGIVAEPSGACATAALLAGVVAAAGLRVGVIVSGGNVSLERFERLVGSRP